MDTLSLLRRLKTMEPKLRSAGLDALYLFGSRARGDHRPDSDVDLAFDLNGSAEASFSLFDQAGLILQLEHELGADVDLVGRRNLRPRVRVHFDHEAVRVFG